MDTSILSMWDIFSKDPDSEVLTSHQSLLEASQAKEKFVVDEVEDVIKFLEGIYKIVCHSASESPKKDAIIVNDQASSIIWKLDKAMEAIFGIARVASSSTHNLGRAIYYSNREKIAVQKHKGSGYFASLRDNEICGKKNRRKSNISFEESVKMFSNEQSQNESCQMLSSMKLTDTTMDDFDTEDENSFSGSSESDENKHGISSTLLHKMRRSVVMNNDSSKAKKKHTQMNTSKVVSFVIR